MANFYPRGNESRRAAHERAAKADRERRELFATFAKKGLQKTGWTNKRDKYEEAHRAELTLWNAASRYLHANLTNTKTLPISKRKQEYADLKEQRDTDYTKLKFSRCTVSSFTAAFDES